MGEEGGVGSRTKGWQTRQGLLGGEAEMKFSQQFNFSTTKSISRDQYWDKVTGVNMFFCSVCPEVVWTDMAGPDPSGMALKITAGSLLIPINT